MYNFSTVTVIKMSYKVKLSSELEWIKHRC